MARALVGSVAGAGVGFLIGNAGVYTMAGAQPASDTMAIAFFVGCFLAGTGAIAGAVIGAVADLREFLARKDESSNDAPGRSK